MVLSMTGFGSSQYTFQNKNITLELKSLNSKSIDISIRMPSTYKSKDLLIRKEITQTAVRGKVDFSIQVESLESNKQYSVNKGIVESYIQELQMISSELDNNEALAIAMRLPEVLSNEEKEISDEEWKAFLIGYKEAYQNFLNFRKMEGDSLEKEFRIQIKTIEDLLKETEKHLGEREERLREKLLQTFQNTQLEIDEQRFHQELIYYIEKFDVSEERVRLQQHIDYFLETLDSPEVSKGKMLGFITQEIGREINTLGSKANNSDLQKIVVQMKDSLEKIKEQTFNVL